MFTKKYDWSMFSKRRNWASLNKKFVRNFSLSGSSLNSVEPDISGQ